MTELKTTRVKIGGIYVISPIGLGNKRWDKLYPLLVDQFPKIPIERISVNKNHLDFSNSQHADHVRDNRSLLTRLMLRWGVRKDVILFDHYDYYFHNKISMPAKAQLYPGELACSLAHLLAWQEICLLNMPGHVALVLEDDALPKKSLGDSIEYPESCDLLHLYPELINNYALTEDNFLRLLPWESSEIVYERMNWTTLGYAITPTSARKLLKCHVLSPHAPIDLTLLNQEFSSPINLYATRKSLLINSGIHSVGYAKKSLIHQPVGRLFAHMLGTKAPQLLTVWRHLFPTRLRMKVRRYLYFRN